MGKSPKTKDFWEKLELFSPPYVRLYAAKRKQGHAEEMTDEEIAKNSGLSLSQVHRITWSRDWDDVTIGEMKKFLRGCNADFTIREKCHHMKLLFARNAAFRHCHRSKDRDFYARLFKFYAGGDKDE